MLVRCESAKEEVSAQVSLLVSSSKSRVAATWLGGVDCDVASRQSSSSRIRLGWRHPLDLAGGAAVSTSTPCDRPLHSVLGTGWEASCAKTASILVGAEGRTALLHDLLAGRKKPPLCCLCNTSLFRALAARGGCEWRILIKTQPRTLPRDGLQRIVRMRSRVDRAVLVRM